MSIYTMKEMPVSERPYEKLEKYGAKSLSNAELIAIILKTGTKEKSALEIAQEVLKECVPDEESLTLTSVPFTKLMKIKGVGRVKAITLKAAFELAYRLNNTKEERLFLGTTNAMGNFVASRLANEKQEKTLIVGLDVKMRLVRCDTIAVGKLSSTELRPREVFRTALECGCAYVVVAHNHPSGDPTPSNEDINATANLINAGKIFDIPVIDHIIVGKGRFLSFKQEKMLKL